jgi:hypothetical protein
MSMKSKRVSRGVLICLTGLAMAACAHHQDTSNIQTMLSAAGFQMKLADTPEKLSHVESFPQRRVVPVQRPGENEPKFVWADAKDCKCMYVGTEGQYQSFANLAVRERIARENYEAAQLNNRWDAWQSAWGPNWWWW